jgi:hypothetical protein
MRSRRSAGHHEPACLSDSFQVDKFWAFILVILPDEHEGMAHSGTRPPTLSVPSGNLFWER